MELEREKKKKLISSELTSSEESFYQNMSHILSKGFYISEKEYALLREIVEKKKRLEQN